MTPEEVLRAFATALRKLREDGGYSQSDLGFDRSHIHRMELGEIDPKLTTLTQLARALRISFPALAAEIDRHRRVLDPAADGVDEMLEGRILLLVRNGRMDQTKNRQFLVEVFGVAKALGARKVLLDLSGMICDFSSEEQYEGAMDGLKVFEELDYQPGAVAVVHNATLGPFGAKVARDHGVNVLMCGSREEAIRWLRSQPG